MTSKNYKKITPLLGDDITFSRGYTIKQTSEMKRAAPITYWVTFLAQNIDFFIKKNSNGLYVSIGR